MNAFEIFMITFCILGIILVVASPFYFLYRMLNFPIKYIEEVNERNKEKSDKDKT